MFAPIMHFQHCLLFGSKAAAYPSRAPFLMLPSRVGSQGPSHKHLTRLERPARFKTLAYFDSSEVTKKNVF